MIVELTRGVATAILGNLRTWDRREVEALIPGEAWDLAERCLATRAWGILHRKQPVAAFGYAKRSIASAEGWTLGTDDFPKVAGELIRFIRGPGLAELRANGTRVLEARSIDGHLQSHRWLENLGFDRVATLPNQGRGGEAFHLFTWQIPNE